MKSFVQFCDSYEWSANIFCIIYTLFVIVVVVVFARLLMLAQQHTQTMLKIHKQKERTFFSVRSVLIEAYELFEIKPNII